MRDSVKVVIGDMEISGFISYEIDSNMLIPADAFTCQIGRIDNRIKKGQRFEVYVNEQLEMSGILDKPKRSHTKTSEDMTLEGLDLMGLLVGSSVGKKDWSTLKDMDLKSLSKRLLKDVPFLDKSKIIYGKERKVPGYEKKKKESVSGIFGATKSTSQFEPGISIFEALADYSQRHGLIPWMDPGGTLVFGELAGKNDPVEFSFFTFKTKGREKNNILSATLTDDISQRYSEVTIVSQVQGGNLFSVGDHTIMQTAKDGSFPFYKPLFLQTDCESNAAAKYQVQHELKKREVQGYNLELEVAGHSQDGKNYRANTVCSLVDEKLDLDKNFLLLGRKFKMDKTQGPRTVLTLGKLMEGYTVV